MGEHVVYDGETKILMRKPLGKRSLEVRKADGSIALWLILRK